MGAGVRGRRVRACRFLDSFVGVCWGSFSMARRELTMHVAFAPTRLSAEHLRTAYEIAIPIVERAVSIDESARIAVDVDDCRATRGDRVRGRRR
jgi:hypothetical protein